MDEFGGRDAAEMVIEGCGAIFADSYAMGSGSSSGSGGEHRTPDFGRSCPSGFKSAQRELTLPDAMHEFDAGDRDHRMSESLEPEHRPQTKLDRSVILFDQIIQVFRGGALLTDVKARHSLRILSAIRATEFTAPPSARRSRTA